jgi:low affinity Fe/Cu permease
MCQSIRRSLVPVAVTAALSLVSWLLVVSARAGALEHRVTVTERQQTAIVEKLDRLIDLQRQTREAVVRLEVKHEGRQ